MAFGEVIALTFQGHATPINTNCVQNAECYNVKAFSEYYSLCFVGITIISLVPKLYISKNVNVCESLWA
jgi:hypothetical protein